MTEIERIARAIEGPHLPVPVTSKFSLEELQEVRWSQLTNQGRAARLNEAASALRAILSARQETRHGE